MTKITIAAMRVIRASQCSTIDSCSIDKLKDEINKKYPNLPKDWSYPHIVSKEKFEEFVEIYLSPSKGKFPFKAKLNYPSSSKPGTICSVVGESRDKTCYTVLLEGSKTRSSYSKHFIEPISESVI